MEKKIEDREGKLGPAQMGVLLVTFKSMKFGRTEVFGFRLLGQKIICCVENASTMGQRLTTRGV